MKDELVETGEAFKIDLDKMRRIVKEDRKKIMKDAACKFLQRHKIISSWGVAAGIYFILYGSGMYGIKWVGESPFLFPFSIIANPFWGVIGLIAVSFIFVLGYFILYGLYNLGDYARENIVKKLK